MRFEVSLSAVQAGGVAYGPNYPDSQPTAWQRQALCAQVGPLDEHFYPTKGGSTRAAKRLCQGCPVVSACLEWALTTDEPHGVWGGMSPGERERERERRQTQEEAAA